MEETEVKFQVDDFDEIIDKLTELGAELKWKGKEKNYFFDTENEDLSDQDKTLRIKVLGNGESTFTFKGPEKNTDSKFKIRTENEVKFDTDNILELIDILNALGFDMSWFYFKTRQHWELNHISIELDTLTDRKFVEIEGTKKEISELADKLGLDWERSTTASYVDLI